MDPFPVYPLGASFVASALARTGVEVVTLDLAFSENPAGEAGSAAEEAAADLVAVAVRAVDNTTGLDPRYYLPAIESVVASVREAGGPPILLGGSGYSLFPEKILQGFGADYGIQGEGELAITRLVAALRSGERAAAGDGLYVRMGGKVEGAPPSGRLAPAKWSAPDYRLFSLEPYLSAGGTAAVQTKRGCPQKCCYCTYPFLEGRRLRLRDPREVVRDVGRAIEIGADYFYFVDNNFNMPAEHARQVCRELAASEFAPGWTAFVTPLAFPAVLAEEMAAAGCRSLELGSEAGSDATLRELGKSHTVAEIVETDRLLFEAGITPAHYFIFGGPGETDDTIEETLSVIDQLNGVCIAMVGVRIYPGTPLHSRSISEGVLHEGRDLLEPAFYVSPAVEREKVLARLTDFAKDHPRFFIAGMEINQNQPVIDRLRSRGRTGPLWEFYALA
jgi:radical SAM superfamily enzyme YgiQ (UPF0313 family)